MPRGRPKGALNKSTKDIKALASKHGPDAIARLVTIMSEGDSDTARIAAARELLDRGYGKAAQTINSTVTQRTVIRVPPKAKDSADWLAQYGPTQAEASTH